jgi:hypothetical protein
MDFLEQMAKDLEDAQNKRHRKAKAKSSLENEKAFWTETEFAIFGVIKTFREKSTTFDPHQD